MVWALLMLLCWRYGCPGEGAALRLENLALRHQLAVLSRARQPRLRGWDRPFWIALKATWAGCRRALVIVRPEADIRMTWDLVRAGQLLRIEILDHDIIGSLFTSLRSLGYFY